MNLQVSSGHHELSNLTVNLGVRFDRYNAVSGESKDWQTEREWGFLSDPAERHGAACGIAHTMRRLTTRTFSLPSLRIAGPRYIVLGAG